MALLSDPERAAAFLGLPPGQQVLDVATGTGALAYALARRGYSVVGIDRSYRAIERAKSGDAAGLDLLFLEGDAARLPFRDNAFDAACISFALHTMTHGTQLEVLREMRRVTRAGGRLLIVDYASSRRRSRYTSWLKLQWPVRSARGRVAWDVPETLLAEAGLRVNKATDRLGLVHMIIADNI